MPSALFVAGAALVLLVGYVANRLWLEFSHSRRARALGCKPTIVRPYRLPFALDVMKRYMDQANQHTAQSDDLVVHEELGFPDTWYQNLLGYWHHVTVDPKNIQAILATQFKDFSLGPLRRGAFEPFIGHGIFTSDGKDWEQSRSLLRPQFARGQVADLTLEETHVQHLLARIDVGEDSWTSAVDLGPLFFNLTLDSATEFFFGQSAMSQTAPVNGPHLIKPGKQADWSDFGRRFDSANAGVLNRGRLMELYFLYNPRSFKEDCRQVHQCVDQVVDLALKRYGEKSSQKQQKYVFVDELVKATQDRDELRSQLLNVLLAGRDTTAGLLGWTFYHLARHPATYQKLREAIVEAFGTGTGNISFETLKGCSYLQHVMLEVLRLQPVVPENARRAVRNTTLPRGGGPDGQSPIYIRAGEEVAYNVNIMHRRKDIWGDNANDFVPERWEGRRYGWEYLPFNGGPRICLGQQFALTEAGYVIARMVQRFDALENLDPSKITRGRFTATTSPVQVLVRLHAAPAEK